MKQETGETRDAIIEDDNREIQRIISENGDRKDPYWICIFAKPAKVRVDGKHTLVKHIKAYYTKPKSQMGMIVGEVDPRRGTIDWEVNMPQRPFDYDGLLLFGAQPEEEVVTETTTIPQAYLTQ